METLSLNQLINLQGVSSGQFSTGSFSCLRKEEVKDCDGLTFLFSLSMGRSLSQLEDVTPQILRVIFFFLATGQVCRDRESLS